MDTFELFLSNHKETTLSVSQFLPITLMEPFPPHIRRIELTCPYLIFKENVNYFEHVEELIIEVSCEDQPAPNFKQMNKIKYFNVNFLVMDDNFPQLIRELNNIDIKNYIGIFPNITKIQFKLFATRATLLDMKIFPNLIHSDSLHIKNYNYENNIMQRVKLYIDQYDFRIKLPAMKYLTIYVYDYAEGLNESLQFLINSCVNLEKFNIKLGSSNGIFILNLFHVKNYVIHNRDKDSVTKVILNGKLITLGHDSKFVFPTNKIN